MFERLSARERALLVPSAAPVTVPAQLATLTEERFSDPAWIFERKLDGVRCIARRGTDGGVRLLSRNDRDMSRTYPEVAVAVSEQAATDVVLDGEIVAFEGRRTSFERLQGRLGIGDPDAALATGIPVFYYVFDLLFADGCDLRRLPLLTRKQLLRRAVSFADPLRFTVHRREAGEEMYRAACARGDEGVIAKRAESTYGGGRSKDWLKFKCVRDQELVVGGWTEPKGSRAEFGALLVGYYDGDTFVYAGKVGTGFDQRTLSTLGRRLRSLEQTESPFGRNAVRERGAHWVRPEIVAQIGFGEWTRDGMLRHPRFQGVRNDKDPREVVRETR